MRSFIDAAMSETCFPASPSWVPEPPAVLAARFLAKWSSEVPCSTVIPARVPCCARYAVHDVLPEPASPTSTMMPPA